MSRQPRRIEPGTVYHLISRFVDREWFITKEQERRLYLQLLGKALSRSDWRCLAFALMSNHVHLATVAGSQTLDSWIRRVHSPFADSMNRAYDRIGTMFVRGPKALPVAPSRVGSVIAYIHNNPVRAKLVARASASTWTSHRAYVAIGQRPPWLHIDEGLVRAGFDNPIEFDRWVAEPGREEFDVAHELEMELDTENQRETESSIRPEPSAIVAATACELGISAAQLCSRRRTAVEMLGREAAIHCAERVGLNGAEIARALGITQQAVSWIHCRGFGDEALAIGARVLQRIVLHEPNRTGSG